MPFCYTYSRLILQLQTFSLLLWLNRTQKRKLIQLHHLILPQLTGQDNLCPLERVKCVRVRPVVSSQVGQKWSHFPVLVSLWQNQDLCSITSLCPVCPCSQLWLEHCSLQQHVWLIIQDKHQVQGLFCVESLHDSLNSSMQFSWEGFLGSGWGNSLNTKWCREALSSSWSFMFH